MAKAAGDKPDSRGESNAGTMDFVTGEKVGDGETSGEPLLENRYSTIEVETETDESESTTESRLADRPLIPLFAGLVLAMGGLAAGLGLVPVSPVIVDVVVIPVIGLAAVAVGLAWIDSQFGGVEGGVVPQVEDPVTDVPGTDVDVLLEGEHRTWNQYRQRTAVRRRLRRLVVATLKKVGHTPAAAQRQVAQENWADDPTAASFFALEGDDRGYLTRLLDRLTPGGRSFGTDARHTIDAAARLSGLDDREWTVGNESGPTESATAPGRTAALAGGRTATTRFRLIGGIVLVAVGLGVLLRPSTLLLMGAVGTSLLAHRYAGGVPEPELAVERTIEADDPDPGDAVTVTTTVENAGDRTLYDLRLIDGVPPTLSVVEGSPRHYTGLRPGASATLSYEIELDHGCHEFDPLGVVARSASGATERTTTAEVDGDTVVTCEPRPNPDVGTPVGAGTRQNVGSIVTDTGGAGIEFHSVREYRSGDPLRRIDWQRLARGGELATLQFDVERSTTVVLLVDTRSEAFVGTDRDASTAVDRSISAAASTVRDLLYSNDKVGLASVGPRRCWIDPRAGRSRWPIVRDALTTDPAFTHPDPDDRFLRASTLHWLRTRLPGDAQIVFFSPLTDAESLKIARSLQARGFPPTVVSPRTTGTDSPGRTVAHLERNLRLSRLRQAGLTAVDWHADEPLGGAFGRIRRRSR